MSEEEIEDELGFQKALLISIDESVVSHFLFRPTSMSTFLFAWMNSDKQ